MLEPVLDFGQILHQVVGPEAGSLADSRRLGRLQMRVCQAGDGAMLLGERRPARRSRVPTARTRCKAFAHQQQIGVVGHIATGGPQVDDSPGLRAGVAKGVDVGHHVVAELALVVLGRVEIDVVDVRLELLRSGWE